MTVGGLDGHQKSSEWLYQACDPGLLLQAEGHIKRTALAGGTAARPAWKQELSFKSVQISSDLQVRCQACRQATGRAAACGVLHCSFVFLVRPDGLRHWMLCSSIPQPCDATSKVSSCI